MKNKLIETIKNIDTSSIPKKRKDLLQTLAMSLKDKINKKEVIDINFICTHNSRRSHLAQIWMQTLAYYLGFNQITTYSGGTESTEIAIPIINTLEKQGFRINKLSNQNNPIYAVKYSANCNPIISFSKKYVNHFNPKNNYIAILNCSEADKGCPSIMGAEKRFKITYEDPKEFDNSALEKAKYKARSIQIATEMYYTLQQINA